MKHQFIDAHVTGTIVRSLCKALESRPGPLRCLRPATKRTESTPDCADRALSVLSMPRAETPTVRLVVHAELADQGVPAAKIPLPGSCARPHIVPKTVRRFRVTTDSRNTKEPPPTCSSGCFHGRSAQCPLADRYHLYSDACAGWLYLAAIIDLHSRAIVGWAMSERMDRATGHGCA